MRESFLMVLFLVSELAEAQQEGLEGALWGQQGLSSHTVLGNSLE